MSTDKGNLLSYLPPEQRQRVLLLIQRLHEETEAKNKLQALYAEARNEINELQLKCNQLKDENTYLKQQMHNSFSMISQVRANFKANRQKLTAHKDDDWEDEEQEQEENKLNTSNTRPHPPKPNPKSSLEKYRPLPTSAEKHPPLNLSSSFLNQSSVQSGSKGRQMQQLRRQVRALQLQKQREEEKAKQLTEKHRLVDEIKHRYRGQRESSNGKQRQESPEKIDITDTFLEEEEDQRIIKVKSSSKKTSQPQETISKIDKKQQPSTKMEKSSNVPQQSVMPKETPPPTKGKQSHAQDDYCDVLDLINDYNL